jgi:hypothetical protein
VVFLLFSRLPTILFFYFSRLVEIRRGRLNGFLASTFVQNSFLLSFATCKLDVWQNSHIDQEITGDYITVLLEMYYYPCPLPLYNAYCRRADHDETFHNSKWLIRSALSLFLLTLLQRLRCKVTSVVILFEYTFLFLNYIDKRI